MKRFGLLFCSFLLVVVINAQLKVTSGATVTVTGGAALFCGGDVINDAGGTITNNGKMEVQGSFVNSGTYNTTTADDSLILSGTGNVLLNGGSSVLTNLWINKTSALDEVKLSGTTLLSGKLDYDQGNFTTDPITNPSYLFSAPASAVFDFAAGKEITGKVRRTSWANGAMTIFNQPNMLITTAGGVAPSDFTVTMIPQSGGGDPTGTEREVKRKFLFGQTGGSGFTTDVRMPYLDAELNTNTEGNMVTWQNISSVWNGRLTPVTRDGANNYVGTTGLTTTDIANEWKLADPNYTMNVTAFLRGAWVNGSSNMRTTLKSGGLVPTTQPYGGAPFNYAGTESVGAVPDSVVDWVLVELRMPNDGLPASATAATAVGRKAAFLLKTGAVVELDGVTPVSFDINKQGAGFIVVRHRNHLGIMSNSLASNTTGSYTNNFSTLGNYYTNPSALSAPATILNPNPPGNTIYGMWPGDVNGSRAVTSTDISLVNATIAGPLSGNTFVYSTRDITLDRNVTSTDVSQTNFSLSATAQQNPSAKNSNGTNIDNRPKKIVSHIPDGSDD